MSKSPTLDGASMAHLAQLARLELSPAETERLKADLNELLGYFEQLREVDTEGVSELVRPVATENVFRLDEVVEPLPQQTTLALAVETESGFFKVPRTVDADA